MIYLGSLGRMVGVACPAEQRSSTADRYSFQTTLGGRVKAQVRPEGRRTWDLRLPRTSTSSDVAVLQAFADGSWGPGPFRFVPAEAPSTNLLPPRVAACDSSENPSYLVVDGGPVQVDGQWFAQSYFNTADVVIFFGKDYESGAVPVDAGQRVTASAFVAGNNSRVRVTFYDQHGDSLGSSYGSSAGSGTAFRRSVVTAVPPAGAVAARLRPGGQAEPRPTSRTPPLSSRPSPPPPSPARVHHPVPKSRILIRGENAPAILFNS